MVLFSKRQKNEQQHNHKFRKLDVAEKLGARLGDPLKQWMIPTLPESVGSN